MTRGRTETTLPGPSGLGYRQRAVLTLLRDAGRAVPFGYVERQVTLGCPTAYNNTNVSLRLLERRGLVHQPRRGWWEAA